MVAIYISELGEVDYVYVVQLGRVMLDNATLDLFTHTLNRFRRALNGGVSVASVVIYPIRYRLE